MMVLAAVAAGSAARAEEASPEVERQAWARVGPVPTFTSQSGRLYVAAAVGTEEARAYVSLSGGAAADAATLVLDEAADGFGTPQARIAACLLTSALPRDSELSASEAPSVDCSIRVGATREADGRWRVPLGDFAPRWRVLGGGVVGVALVADMPAPTPATFRVSFNAAATTISALEPAPEPAPAPAPARAPAPAKPQPPMAGPAPAPPPEPVADNGPPVTVGSAPADTAPDETVSAGRPAGGRRSLEGALSASSPPLYPFLLVLVAGSALVLVPARTRRRVVVPLRLRGSRGVATVGATATLAAVLAPLLASELTVYRAGLVLIFFVAAAGLHMLLNWAGELSLAHAGMIGLPAFVVLALSEVHGISPIYLLPVGLGAGAAVGAAIGLPTLRAKGLQVAFLTLAADIAIQRFFLTRPFLVGDGGGRAAVTPRLFGWELASSRSQYPLLLLVVAAVAAASWALLHSKVARAWFWIRAEPAAAAAFGIPVQRYRILAYTAAGAMAGLAGALTAMWVQHVPPSQFHPSLSFTYLVVAVLGGPGFLGGVGLAAAGIEGGRLFLTGAGPVIAYLGPVALVSNLTKFPTGLNGLGRTMIEHFKHFKPAHGAPEAEDRQEESHLPPLTFARIGGTFAIAAGFLAIGLAWYHAGNTTQLWIQNQELISGGFGGIALVVVGVGLLIADRLRQNNADLLAELRRESLSRADGSAPLSVTRQRRARPPLEDVVAHRG